MKFGRRDDRTCDGFVSCDRGELDVGSGVEIYRDDNLVYCDRTG